ncbi:protein kinase [Streptomyces sp. NPDC029216]|uniref:protein kinase domain-containing protein n=1 Tax=Streptomyces sp. NPDC029216 TaxID=3154701 RepID=UPI0033F68C07
MGSPLLPEDPERIGAYWPASRLGEGAQGVVYEAYDRAGNRVAVKVLRRSADESVRRLFHREAEAAQRVAGFCTARVLEVSSGIDEPYLVGEYVPGPSLGVRVRDGGRLAADEVVRLAIGIATGLAAIHRAGVVHRDLKPGNVLLGPDGPRIIDFGIARSLDMSQTASGVIMGTLGYMAPEVLSGKRAGPAADVFAWGATVLYAASGEEPFRGENVVETAYRTVRHRPDLSTVPPSLRAMVSRALSQDPDHRPAATEILLSLLGDPADAPAPGSRPGAGTAESPAADPRIALMQVGARRAGPAAPDAGDRVPTLGERAEEAWAALPERARPLAHELMLRLVVPGPSTDGSEDTVRSASRAELLAGRPDTEQHAMAGAVASLTEGGVLLVLPDGGVRPAPALIPAWPRLRGWIETDRAGTAVRLWLTTTALAWERNGRRSEDLPHGSEWARCAAWLPTAPLHLRPNPLESACAGAASAAARRAVRRRRRVRAGLSVVTVLALLAGGAAWLQSREIDRRQAEATARTTAQSAETLRGTDPVAAMLLGLASWRVAEVPESRAALIAAASQREIQATPTPAFTYGESTERMLSGTGRHAFLLSHAGLSAVRLTGADRARARTLLPPGTKVGLLVSSHLSEDGSVVVVPAQDERTVQVVSAGDGNPLAPPLTLNGRHVAGVTNKGELVLGLPAGGTELVAPTGGTITSVPEGASVAPDGRHIVSCSTAGVTVRPVAGGPGVLIPRPSGSQEPTCYRKFLFSPDGGRVGAISATGSGNSCDVVVYDLAAGRVVGEAAGLGSEPRFSSRGNYLVSTNTTNGIEVWSADGGSLPVVRVPAAGLNNLSSARIPVWDLALDEETESLLQWTGDTVHHLDVSGALTGGTPVRTYVAARAVSGQGRTALVTERFSPDLSGRSDRFQGRVIDTRTGKDAVPAFRQNLWVAQDLPSTALGDISDDGRLIAFTQGGPDDRYGITLREVGTGRDVLHWASAEGTGPAWLDLAPDGAHIAALQKEGGVPTGAGDTLKILDVRTRKEVHSVSGTQANGAFSPDGRRFLSTDGTLLDLKTGTERKQATFSGGVRSVAFSPDGRLVAAFRETGLVELWNGQVTQRITTMSSSVSRGGGRGGQDLDEFTFSQDGRLLAAVVNGDSIQLWDTDRHYALGDPLLLPGRGVEALAFDGDDLWAVAGTRARSVDLSPARLAERVCRRAGRDLTDGEWSTYLPGVPRRRLC